MEKEQDGSSLQEKPNKTMALTIFREVVGMSRLQDKKLQTALSGLSVHPAQYSCLFAICQHEGMNLGELAQLLQIENSTASVSVRRMEKAGLVERRPDEFDNRMTRLYATRYGKEQFQLSKGIMEEFIAYSFGDLSDREMMVLHGLLTRISGRVSRYQVQRACP
jgi:DNA-binding MarR family transcriptional regulator